MPVEIKIMGENAKEALVELSTLAGGLTPGGGETFRPASAPEEAPAPRPRGRSAKANAEPGNSGEAAGSAPAANAGPGVGAGAEARGPASREAAAGTRAAGAGEAAGAAPAPVDGGQPALADASISQRIAAAEAESAGAVTEQMVKDMLTEFLKVTGSAAKAQQILEQATGHKSITFIKNDPNADALLRKAYDALKAGLGANG